MTPVNIDENVLDEATEWFARLRRSEVSEHLRNDFRTWLGQSPEHHLAYTQIDELWDSLAVAEEIPLQLADGNKLVNLLASWRDCWQKPLLIAAAMCLLAAVLILPINRNNPAAVYMTRVGEQKDFILADGSHIYLNTDSQVTVDLEADKRLVYLDRGEVFFNVTHDLKRPFIVLTSGGFARVLGTKFNIIRWQGKSVVTVMEGSVAVASVGEQNPPMNVLLSTDKLEVELAPNEQIVLSREALGATPKRVDAAATQAWRERKLVYNGESLTQVLADISRYFPGNIKIGDADLKNLEVIAVLDIQDKQSMLAVLEDAFALRAERISHDLTILYPRF